MKGLGWIACVLVVVAVTSCGSDDGPAGNGVLDHPDIPGLVVFYNFDGDLNNAVSDLHHGSSSGALTYVPDHRGSANSAAQVDTDTILVADHADLRITGALTISAWIMPGVINSVVGTIVDKDAASAYMLGVWGCIAPDTVMLVAGVSDNSMSTDDAIPCGTGTWSHVAFTYDSEAGEGKFYINGALAATRSPGVAIGVNEESLRIGSSLYGYKYKGAIDQLAIFNRALTPAEVNEVFNFE